MLGFGFVTPWLLAGLVAAGIPFLLHLLAAVRAKEVPFPTLRFLKDSMEKTARRRKVQQWLLLLLRTMLLAALVFALAEPITRAAGGWLSGGRYNAVVIIDNSASMQIGTGQGSRLSQAKSEAIALLEGVTPPHMAAVLATNSSDQPTVLSGDIGALRMQIDRMSLSGGRANIAQKVRQALELLESDPSVPQKSVFLFCDLQKSDVDELSRMQELAQASDVHLMVVNSARNEAQNVGITDIQASQTRIVNASTDITAELTNTSETSRRVRVGLEYDGKMVGGEQEILLDRVGKAGSVANVQFRIDLGEVPGEKIVRVMLLDADDLMMDNSRLLRLHVADRVRTLVVYQNGERPGEMNAATMLEVALDPWKDHPAVPWSIKSRSLTAKQFTPDDLQNVDAVYFSNVEKFSQAQADAIQQFVQRGGTAVFFLGPKVDAKTYNRVFSGRFLPGTLGQAVGQIGPDAPGIFVDDVAMDHPYLKNLYPSRQEYLTPMVQRYYQLDRSGPQATVLMRLSNGDPLMLTRQVGTGRVTLCATAASGDWSNFLGSGAGVIVSTVLRACLLSPQNRQGPGDYPSGAEVTLYISQDLPQEGNIHVTLPSESGKPSLSSLRIEQGKATFGDSWKCGVYHWRIAGGKTMGSFTVNPVALESDVRSYRPQQVQEMLRRRDVIRTYVGDSLDQVTEAALQDAKPRNWWDVALLAVVIVLLLEAMVANRPSRLSSLSTSQTSQCPSV